MVDTMNDVLGNERIGHTFHLTRIMNRVEFRKGILGSADRHADQNRPDSGVDALASQPSVGNDVEVSVSTTA
jgi:hypothetical protein